MSQKCLKFQNDHKPKPPNSQSLSAFPQQYIFKTPEINPTESSQNPVACGPVASLTPSQSCAIARQYVFFDSQGHISFYTTNSTGLSMGTDRNFFSFRSTLQHQYHRLRIPIIYLATSSTGNLFLWLTFYIFLCVLKLRDTHHLFDENSHRKNKMEIFKIFFMVALIADFLFVLLCVIVYVFVHSHIQTIFMYVFK